MSKKVINHKNLPSRLPLSSIVLCFFLMHYINAPIWVYVLLGIYWLLVLIAVFRSWKNDKHVNIFNTIPETKKTKKKSFTERINDKYRGK